ncbi:MAG: biotin/lipoate A/B protein ligase family protein [Candidatus Bathyarchaeia archaeon]|nr:lipoate--protein ligase family protein [Candidatus Bathyarchaeota archaeon]
MIEEWRLLELTINDAYMNMAIDEAILTMIQKGKSPNTIRFYRWNPSAVSIGYFQSLIDEVDVEACKKLNVDIVRRITGGGAVYHDYNGEVTYSVIASKENPKIPEDILESYNILCNGIVLGLKKLGLTPAFKPINDIIVNGKKISGNAQTRKLNAILQHGTILIDVDVEKMFKVLKVSNEKIKDKMITSVKERVTSVKKELGKEVDFNEVAEALKKGFEEALNIKLSPGELTEEEKALAEKLKIEKYSAKEWLYKR